MLDIESAPQSATINTGNQNNDKFISNYRYLNYNGIIFQGGFDYKKAIVDSIIIIIEENPEAKEAGKYQSISINIHTAY